MNHLRSTLLGLLLLSVPLALTQAMAAEKPRICALYPHLKDSYWLSVNAGMVDAMQGSQAELKVMEAGGYANEAVQITQFQHCLDWPADVILLGSVSYQLPAAIQAGSQTVPTLALVNQVAPGQVTTTIGVSWQEKGRNVAQFINERYPAGGKLPTLLMLGPKGSGGNRFIQQGLAEHLESDTLVISAVLHGDNSVASQRALLRRYLAEHPAPGLIIGGAVAIEVAVSELQNLGLSDNTELISTYLSHGVYRGLLREKVVMANSDQMRAQGRMAIEAALALAAGQTLPERLAPPIRQLTPPLDPAALADSLSDPGFQSVYQWPGN